MDKLIEVIHLINEEHKSFSEKIICELENINLKKKRVDHVVRVDRADDIVQNESYIDNNFMVHMNTYCSNLPNIYNTDLFDMTIGEEDFSLRIKDPSSRVSKLMNYRFKKKEQGAVSLNKCLNDLLGFRIILDSYDFKELCELLASHPIKVHNSDKGNYKATHLYFNNQKNIYYPWELQIWLKKDEALNYSSHSKHKQNYTTWPRLYHQTMKED